MKCGAKTRDGSPCQKHPVKGAERCHLHGGRSRKGPDHPGWKHGLYSKHAGPELSEILDELEDVDSESLIDPKSEIKLMQALILHSKALKREVSDLEDLERLSRIVDRLVFSKQRSQKILLEQQRLIPASDIERFLDFLEDLLIKQVDSGAAHQVMKQLKNFRLSEHQMN